MQHDDMQDSLSHLPRKFVLLVAEDLSSRFEAGLKPRLLEMNVIRVRIYVLCIIDEPFVTLTEDGMKQGSR